MAVTEAVEAEARSSAQAPVTWRTRLPSLDTLALPLVILGMIVLFSLLQPRFATGSNVQNVSRQASLLAISAAAQMFPILSGGFDISIGSIIGLTSVITAMGAKQFGLIPGIAMGVVLGGFLGAINGLVIARFKVSPFVITLGMMSIARGIALLITNGQPIYDLPPGFNYLGSEYLGPFSIPLVIAIVVFLVSHFALTMTRFGRYVYAIGGNEESARLSGINVSMHKMLAYTACGLITGVGGVVLTSRVESGQPNLGIGSELDAIAAVVIGGVALGGGQGDLLGVLFGVVIISLLSNGLNLVNVSSYLQMITIGIVIGLAVILDQVRHRREGAKS